MYAGFQTEIHFKPRASPQAAREVPHKHNYVRPTYKQNYDQEAITTRELAGWLAGGITTREPVAGWLAEAQRRPERGPDRPRKAEWG